MDFLKVSMPLKGNLSTLIYRQNKLKNSNILNRYYLTHIFFLKLIVFDYCRFYLII